jgi:hypothetical protein
MCASAIAPGLQTRAALGQATPQISRPERAARPARHARKALTGSASTPMILTGRRWRRSRLHCSCGASAANGAPRSFSSNESPATVAEARLGRPGSCWLRSGPARARSTARVRTLAADSKLGADCSQPSHQRKPEAPRAPVSRRVIPGVRNMSRHTHPLAHPRGSRKLCRALPRLPWHGRPKVVS